MVRVFKLSCLSWLMTVSSVNAIDPQMNFTSQTVDQLVALLMASNADIEYKDVRAAPVFSQCARYFTGGYSLGNLHNITNGTVDNGVLIGPDGNPVPIVPDKGIMLSSGTPENFNGQDSDKQTTQFTVSSTDTDLQTYVEKAVFDACWIEFKFKCTATAYVPAVSFKYVFGSEEYYEYANTDFNDAFAFFLNGVNIARLPTTETNTDIVSINNVNYGTNSKYFYGNDPGFNSKGSGPGLDPVGVPTINWYPYVEADGLTSKLTAIGNPIYNDWNTIKLVVADVGDAILDSWVLLETGTFGCVNIPTEKPTQKPTATPTAAPTTKSPTARPTANPTKKPTAAPTTKSPTTRPTANPTKKPTGSPTAGPTSSPTARPTANPTKKPTAAPTDKPTTTPTSSPTARPTANPTKQPTAAPTSSPTARPTANPTKQPTVAPTSSPTARPTANPTKKPTAVPTSSPTTRPTANPTKKPTAVPTSSPTTRPTANPTKKPTAAPTSNPTNNPTQMPTTKPTQKPTLMPTSSPTAQPSTSTMPSAAPSSSPSESSGPTVSSKPSIFGSLAPSVSSAPSDSPTNNPTKRPTPKPTNNPTTSPTNNPTKRPTTKPTNNPTTSPTNNPTKRPTTKPTNNPTTSPTNNPTKRPTTKPTKNPTTSPTVQPSISLAPSVHPSLKPSVSSSPSEPPSSQPSVSSMPSRSPSLHPSISSKPSVTGSSQPSVSSAPSISPASIGPNVVFNDKNGNGVQDEGEVGLPNVDIVLYNDGVEVAKTATNQDGVYEFQNLPEGTYYIQIKKDPDYTFSSNAVSQDGTTEPVTLKLGDNIDTWDVGMFIPVILGNKVFDDLNGNAIQDIGEPGLEGITVTLVKGSGVEIATQITAADGSYLFTGLPPGSYSVQFEIPESYAFTPPSNLNMDIINSGLTTVVPDYASDVNMETGITAIHVLESGDVDMTYDAAIFRPVSVSGVTWHDLNANGVQDDGEPGLEGSTIVLHNDDGDVVDMKITGPDGSYLFSGLPPDGYYSVIMPPSPEYLLSPSGEGYDNVFDPNSYMSYPVNLSSGESGDGANAGMYKLASIGDWVWNDALANGIQDANEVGFGGPVTINLYNSNGDIIQTTQTDGNGFYKFNNIVPGNFEVEFIIEEGKEFTIQNAGGDDTKDSDVDPLTGNAQMTLVSGEEKHVAAGITVLASVGPNTVFDDTNGNGIQDEGESGESGVVIHLVDDGGNRVATTTSNSNGEYHFQNLPPGNYHIIVDLNGGFSFSPVVEGGNQIIQVDDQPYGTSPVVELTVGTQENTWNVGLFQPVSVGNKVWNDLNGNGIQDTNEPGMQGVTAILVDGSGTELDRTATDENGLYLFEGLKPGTYAVKFVIPDEYLFTPAAKTTTPITNKVDGSLNYDDVTSDVNVDTGATDAVFLSSGETNLSFDAGIFIPVSISGATWHDLNANGVKEEGEPGLPGSTVTLYDGDGDYVGIKVTDSEGNFLFEGLPPGTYHTVLSPPSPEYLLSPKKDDNDSDFNPDTFKTSPITLNSGESGEGAFDAGLYLPAKIGDRVWYDESPNGIQDGDENAFAGPVAITLYDSLGFVVQTTTPETGSGLYQFDGLTPGTYELMAVIDELGYVFTMPRKGNNTELDSDVNPTSGKVKVTVSSGEENNSIDIGIMDDAPYYPDWTNDAQICTNDGFDPEWLEIQKVNYLYKNKEACCKQHFWWRITQCMQNEEFKFFKNGEICDTKIYFEDWESNSPAEWTETTQFDTLDECCANKFWYDIDGCMERSPVMFKFEFCVDVKGLVEPLDCQSADIYANVLEDAINAGVNLDAATEADKDLTDANITSIGNVTLTKERGSTVCGGSLEGQQFINDKTGTVPDIEAAANTVTTICGVITVEDAVCTEKDCLMEHYQNLTQTMRQYVNDGEFTSTMNLRATNRLPPVPELQEATGVDDSFTTSNLLLPATITGDANSKFYHGSDLKTCMTKTFFLPTERPYVTLYECCKQDFHYDVRSCCIEGGGCPELGIDETKVEYYPTWAPDKLCGSKSSASFESWETNRFEKIEDCCKTFFANQYDQCVSQHDV